MADVLERVSETLRPIAGDVGVELKIARTSLKMHADADRLVQVFVNVAANALRLSPRGTCVSVTVEPHGTHVHINVDDQGPGVPTAFRDTIFQPFKQVSGSVAHNKGGTGLGLSISGAIVKEHGGWITVGDASGGGARFTIGLPIRK